MAFTDDELRNIAGLDEFIPAGPVPNAAAFSDADLQEFGWGFIGVPVNPPVPPVPPTPVIVTGGGGWRRSRWPIGRLWQKILNPWRKPEEEEVFDVPVPPPSTIPTPPPPLPATPLLPIVYKVPQLPSGTFLANYKSTTFVTTRKARVSSPSYESRAPLNNYEEFGVVGVPTVKAMSQTAYKSRVEEDDAELMKLGVL